MWIRHRLLRISRTMAGSTAHPRLVLRIPITDDVTRPRCRCKREGLLAGSPSPYQRLVRSHVHRWMNRYCPRSVQARSASVLSKGAWSRYRVDVMSATGDRARPGPSGREPRRPFFVSGRRGDPVHATGPPLRASRAIGRSARRQRTPSTPTATSRVLLDPVENRLPEQRACVRGLEQVGVPEVEEGVRVGRHDQERKSSLPTKPCRSSPTAPL